jgi:hypothetical protein
MAAARVTIRSPFFNDRPRVTELPSYVEVLRHLEIVHLRELAVGPDDGESVAARQLLGVASNGVVERFNG